MILMKENQLFLLSMFRLDKVLDENYMTGEWGGTPEFEGEE